MSWLFKSLQSDDPQDFSLSSSPSDLPQQDNSPTDRGGGVKEDLTVIGESIGRQLRGVASFLAPPPSVPSTTEDKSQQSSDSFSSSSSSLSQSQALIGVRNDLVEIGGSLKSGLSLLSSNRAFTDISKFTSSFLQFPSNDNQVAEDDDEDDYNYEDEGEYDDYTPEITEEVLKFVKEISVRSEYWTDFPLPLETDFKMSDVQREHASTVEHMVPSLTALRENLHSYMGDEKFWLIYFILVLPRMNEEDMEILSSSEIVETRNLLLGKLQKTRNVEEVKEIVNETRRLEINDEKNSERCLNEAVIDFRTSLDRNRKLEHEDDVSFSDLEDDNNDLSSRASRPSISREKDSDAESSDWLKVDHSD